MNKINLLTFLLLLGSIASHAQQEFRNRYLRFGLNRPQKELQTALSPKENVLDGRLGAKTGFSLEFGRIFHLNNQAQTPLKYGLDWTILSASYQHLNWKSYAEANQVSSYHLRSPAMILSLATKIGPVLSYNPFEKVILDIRVQAAPVAYYLGLNYEEQTEGGRSGRYLGISGSTDTEKEQAYGDEIDNTVAFGIQPAFGLTLRRDLVGFSLDFLAGGVKEHYQSDEGNDRAMLKMHRIEFKLNLSL